MIKYLYSNGCSYTEGYGLENPKEQRYSKILADSLGAEDINESLGGESNQRIYRKTFDWISNNKSKLDDTLFVIQLSYPVRNEIWFSKKQQNGKLDEKDKHWYGAQFGHDGYTAWESHQRDTSVDKEEINFNYVPPNYVTSDISWRYVLGLQSFFKVNNIKHIFFEGHIHDDDGSMNKKSKLFDLVDETNFFNIGFRNSAGDRLTPCSHPNKEVQKEWAEKLLTFFGSLYG
jgi:hypothetical protein